jgi:hypothetical protein
MAAVAAAEFRVIIALFHEAHEVPAKHACQRVANLGQRFFLPKKGMAAIARVLKEPAPLADGVDPMAEQPASMTNGLVKGLFASVT